MSTAVLGAALVVLVALFATGLPVYLCFILIIIFSVLQIFGTAGFGMFVNSIYNTGTTESLTTVALFILMGEILFRSGSIEVLLNSVDKLIGRVRGRQYVLTISLSTILGALSGSGIAVAAMLGRSVMPAMLQRGYDKRLSTGTVLAGALLAPIIPPSILAIIIGTLADVSIGALLIAGVIPGIVLGLIYIAGSLGRVVFNPSLAPNEEYVKSTTMEKLVALGRMAPFSIVIFFVIGLIMLGVATPSESAATGVVAALLVAAWYRKLSFRLIFDALGESAALSAVILIIIASAILFGQLLAFTGTVQYLATLITDLAVNRWVIFFLLMLIPFILCMFVDQIGLMMVLIPIYDPLIKTLGFDPIWFWMQFLINMTLGGITPPFGYILFALAGAVPSVSIRDVYKAAWPFVFLTLAGMLLFCFVPEIVTFLPSLF